MPNAAVPPDVWRILIANCPEFHFSVWTPRMQAADMARLPRDCFDVCYNSLAWWDFGADWFGDELARLRPLAPVASSLGLPAAPPSAMRPAVRPRDGCWMSPPATAMDCCCRQGSSLAWRRIPPVRTSARTIGGDCGKHAWLDLTLAVRDANRGLNAHGCQARSPSLLSSTEAPVAVLFEPPARLTVANRHLERRSALSSIPPRCLPLLNGGLHWIFPETGRALPLAPDPMPLAPGEVRVFSGHTADPVVTAKPREGKQRRDPAASCAVRRLPPLHPASRSKPLNRRSMAAGSP